MQTTFVTCTLRGLVLAGALVFTGLGALPAAAQSKSDVINEPQAVSYSWGVIVSPDDGPQTSYLLDEKAAAASAQRVMSLILQPVSYEEYLRSLFTGSEFDTD